MAFDLTALSTYTDELSLELIAKAVLTTDLMEEIDVRSGLSAGTVAINLMDGDLNVADLACGWNPSGDVNFSQVDITIRDKQVKMELCPEDLRQYWISQRMAASAHAEEVPFAETIASYYVERVKKYNETFLISGDGTANGIKQQVTTANGANLQGGTPAAWTATNALEQALDLYDAIGEEVKDRDDLIMIVAPAAYRALTRALVAANLYHYNDVTGNEIVELPGTNIKVVKSAGLVGSDYACAGPAGFIVAGTGLEDDMSNMQFYFDKGEDVVKFIAKWRLGVAVHQVNVFATNGLA
jgi:hypothetical protein